MGCLLYKERPGRSVFSWLNDVEETRCISAPGVRVWYTVVGSRCNNGRLAETSVAGNKFFARFQ